MRILHVAETVKGGIASYFDELIPAQIEKFGADNVRLLVPGNQVGEMEKVPKSAMLVFWPSRTHRAINLMAVAAAHWRQAWRWRPDIVHVHSSVAGISCRLVPNPSGTRLIYCAHGWSFARRGNLSNFLAGLMERLLSARSTAIICLSKHDFDVAVQKGIPPARLHVIPNGIDTATPVPAPCSASRWRGQRVRVLFVGRFDFQKGFDTFAQALHRLTGTHHALAIGMPVVDGNMPGQLPANVDMIGWQPRSVVHQYMADADVVVVPSRWEGAPITVLEAMRGGAAVVATRVGAIPEQVADGVNGVLIEPDDPDQLATALARHSGADFRAMGHAGRQRFLQLFSSERMNASTLNLYARIARATLGEAWLTEAAGPNSGRKI